MAKTELGSYEFKNRFSKLLENNKLARELRIGEKTLEEEIENFEERFYKRLGELEKISKVKLSTAVNVIRKKMPLLKKETQELEEIIELISEIKYAGKKEVYKNSLYSNLKFDYPSDDFKSLLAVGIGSAFVGLCSVALPPLFAISVISTIFSFITFGATFDLWKEMFRKYKKDTEKFFAIIKKDAEYVDLLVQKNFVVDFYRRNPEIFKKVFMNSKNKEILIGEIKENGVENKECDKWLKENFPRYYKILNHF